MNPLIIVVCVAAAALLYVIAPVAWSGIRNFRRPRKVTCPQTGEQAEVHVTPLSAAMTEFRGDPKLTLDRCSNWPDREDCDQDCARDLLSA